MELQLSLLCGDPFSIETVLMALLGLENDTLREIYDHHQVGAGFVPLDVHWNEQRFTVDLHLCAYHSWLTSKYENSIHGHIVVYSVRRAASFAHARAAVSRVLDDGCHTLTGRAILLVAVLPDYFSDEETNLLLVEGSELATSIGASFITIPLDLSCSQTNELARFFERVRTMVPKTSTFEQSMLKNSSTPTNPGKRNSGCVRDSNSMYDMYMSSHSTGTLLSQSSTSGESSLSTGPLERLISASSVPMLRNADSAINTAYSSTALKPRLRMAQVISPHHLPISYDPPLVASPLVAPLATPEAIDVAAEYSVVQDALVDDEHIYAIPDFCAPTTTTITDKHQEKEMSSNSEKEKRCHSSTEPSSSSSTVTSQPSSTGSSMSAHRDDVADSKRLLPSMSPVDKLHWEQRHPSADSQLAKTARIKPRVAPKPATALSNPRMICSLPSRSITMDVINRESVVKAKQMFAQRAMNLPVLRQSISVESLADLMYEKKKRFRFVRKVATSFRFKKDKEGAVEKSVHSPLIGSRSLPQSPQVERKTKKPNSLVSSEKPSNAFSWLPSRSPKRGHKASQENVQGVVGVNDTLQSLAEKNSGLPLFLMRCVEFIEKGGGLEMEGLYRVPGNQAQLCELEKAFREKGDVDIASLDVPVHVVATAVKNFFSCLSEPLIPTNLHKDILECLNGSEIVERLQSIMDRLTPVNRNVLVYFISHLNRVASSPSTAMDIHNLSKVLFPTLFRPQFHDFLEMSSGTAKFQQVTEVILTNAVEIFQTHQAQSIRV